MFVIFLLLLFVCNIRAEDSNEVKYIDLLPEEEKRQFIQSIAKRIIEEVNSKNENAAESREISEDQLNEHSEYVSKLLREETENLRRKNIEKFDETPTTDAPSTEDDYLKVQRLEKYDSSNEKNKMDNLDLTSDKGKAEKLIRNADEVTTEEDVSTPEITTENPSTILIETTSHENEKIQPKNVSIEISIEDDNTDSSDNVNQTSKQATDVNEPTLQTIPVNIIYDSKIGANGAKDMNEENGNTKISPELSTTNDSNKEFKKKALRQNKDSKIKSPKTVTVMEDFSPEAISDSVEDLQTSITFKEAARTTTTVADEDWVFTAAILEPKGRQNENIEPSTEIKGVETTRIVDENTEASINNDTVPVKDDINSTQVAKPEEETRKLRKIRNSVTTHDLPITEETSTKENKENITDSTTISPSSTELKSFTDNSVTTDKSVKTTVNNNKALVTESTKTYEYENTENIPVIIEESNSKTKKVIEAKENVSIAEGSFVDKSQTDENQKHTENTAIIKDSNYTTETVLEAKGNVSMSPERSGLNKSEPNEKRKHALPDIKYETQIEDSKLFNKLKSKYDKEKEYFVYEIAPGEQALEKVQALEKERIANQIVANKETSTHKPFNREHFDGNEIKNMGGATHYIPVHNYGHKNAYFNSHNSFDLNPDESRAVDGTNEDIITVDIILDTRNQDSDSAFKKLRSPGKTVDIDEKPYVIPVHSYGPENAYFNAHNSFDLNSDDTVDHETDLNADINVNLSREDLAPKKSLPELRVSNKHRNIDEPDYVPVHNYASEYAYFNPHNRFEPSLDDSETDDSDDADVSFNLRERSAPKISELHKHRNTGISKTNKRNSFLHKPRDFKEDQYVPIHNYAPKNAYYNPRNIYGPNYDVNRPEKDLKLGINTDVDNHNRASDQSGEKFRVRSSDIEDYIDEKTEDVPRNVQTGNNVRISKYHKKKEERPFEFRQKNTMLKPVDNFDMDYFYGRKNNDEWSEADVEHPTQQTRRDKLIMTDSDSPDHPFHSRHKKVLTDPTSWARHVLFNHNRLGFHTRLTTRAEESYDDVVITTPIITTNKRYHHYVLKARDDTPKTLSDEKDKTILKLRNDEAKKLLMKRFNSFPEPRPLTQMPEVENKKPNILRAKTTTEATTTPHILDSERLKIILDISEPHDAIVMIDKLLEYSKPQQETHEKKKTKLLRVRNKYNKIWKFLNKLPSDMLFRVPKKSKLLSGRPKLIPILPNVIPYKTKAVPNKPKPFIDPRVLEYLPSIEKMIQQKQQKRLEKDSKVLDAYVDVIRDMIRNDNKALKQYDWLGTAVDVRSAIAKLIKLIDTLANGEKIHPSDMQLLKYLLYLHNFSKNAIESKNAGRKRFADSLKPSHQQLNLKDELMKTKDIGNRDWLIKSINKADKEFEKQLDSFENFLYDLQTGLMDLHDAIKHIAVITKFKQQKWYENLKDLYFKGASKAKLIPVVVHLVTTRLFGLIQNSVVNGLDDNYVGYMEKNAAETSRTKREFILVLKLLNKLKNG